MFIIKVKGKAKIPDYIQLRDDNYTLLAYFRADRPEKSLIKHGFESNIEDFKKIIQELPYGKMQKLSL